MLINKQQTVFYIVTKDSDIARVRVQMVQTHIFKSYTISEILLTLYF